RARRSRRENGAGSLGTCFTRSDGILVAEAQGQTVLLRLSDGSYYALDEVGALIWELCDGERSLQDIVTELCSQFEATERTVTADVIEFVGELQREQLLVEAQ